MLLTIKLAHPVEQNEYYSSLTYPNNNNINIKIKF